MRSDSSGKNPRRYYKSVRRISFKVKDFLVLRNKINKDVRFPLPSASPSTTDRIPTMGKKPYPMVGSWKYRVSGKYRYKKKKKKKILTGNNTICPLCSLGRPFC